MFQSYAFLSIVIKSFAEFFFLFAFKSKNFFICLNLPSLYEFQRERFFSKFLFFFCRQVILKVGNKNQITIQYKKKGQTSCITKP